MPVDSQSEVGGFVKVLTKEKIKQYSKKIELSFC